ncbi:MAG: 16S rRNA (guanine(966)-N(2))-methyltransferase RsmD [Acidobacteria bacterium]|nr:MAG: 16S rRNA (guanine(966)-N(2))-methyltransferase RsmD [Acidobacteriota bacterium]
MRIISGTYGGRHLATVRGDIRPTSDRLRETLFDVLPDVEGSTWLDAFAGSGAVGIEALSRGARHVVFNDRNRDAIRLIKKNLELCGIEGGYVIRELDVFAMLRSLRPPFPDYVYFDPPYDFGRHAKLLDRMLTFRVMSPDMLIILETFKKNVVEPPEEYEVLREVLSSDSRLTFVKLKPRIDADKRG